MGKSNKIYKRICLYCNKSFSTPRIDKFYCNRACHYNNICEAKININKIRIQIQQNVLSIMEEILPGTELIFRKKFVPYTKNINKMIQTYNKLAIKHKRTTLKPFKFNKLEATKHV